jgi:hypothetical protein
MQTRLVWERLITENVKRLLSQVLCFVVTTLLGKIFINVGDIMCGP